MSVSPLLDLSFRQITSVSQIRLRCPRRGFKRYRRSPGGRFVCHVLRLNNNCLSSLEGLHTAATQVLEEPAHVLWLDLSFNQITSLSPELTSTFPHLKILYLHGNHLVHLEKVLKQLTALPHLHRLTLHGNPLEEWRGYKQLVLMALVQLRALDFTDVTPTERRQYDRKKSKKTQKDEALK